MAGTTLVQSGHHFAANNNPIILGDEVPKSMDGNNSEMEECTVDFGGWESLVSNWKLTCFVCRDDRDFLFLDRTASLLYMCATKAVAEAENKTQSHRHESGMMSDKMNDR